MHSAGGRSPWGPVGRGSLSLPSQHRGLLKPAGEPGSGDTRAVKTKGVRAEDGCIAAGWKGRKGVGFKCLRRRHTTERRAFNKEMKTESDDVGNQFGVSSLHYCLRGRTVTQCRSISLINRFLLCVIKNLEANTLL